MTPLVGILVGSKSDMPVLEKCTSRLEELGVEHEIEVRSAHRDPEGVSEYAGTARERDGADAAIAPRGPARLGIETASARLGVPYSLGWQSPDETGRRG